MTCMPLERRVMLSITYVDRVVRIVGGPGPDEIDVFLSGSSSGAVVNGRETRFSSAFEPVPRKVVIDGGGGNDVIELRSLFGRVLGRIKGGAGDDEVTLQNYSSVVKGGAGDDVIGVDESVFGLGHTVFGGNGDRRITFSMAGRAMTR